MAVQGTRSACCAAQFPVRLLPEIALARSASALAAERYPMSLLARTSIAVAALSLWSAVGNAKDVKGTPEALFGTYGTNVQQCQESKEEHAFDAPYYRTCANPGCQKRILSHTATRDGFVLRIRDDGNFRTWSERVTVIDNNTIKWTAVKAATLHRCSAPLPPRQKAVTEIPLSFFGTDFSTAAHKFVSKNRREERQYYRIHSNGPKPVEEPQLEPQENWGVAICY